MDSVKIIIIIVVIIIVIGIGIWIYHIFNSSSGLGNLFKGESASQSYTIPSEAPNKCKLKCDISHAVSGADGSSSSITGSLWCSSCDCATVQGASGCCDYRPILHSQDPKWNKCAP